MKKPKCFPKQTLKLWLISYWAYNKGIITPAISILSAVEGLVLVPGLEL